ncbi:subtilase [Plectosphaerella plurivora]|uniref:Subtilase n=1 Tax=Plectosphaerella plurivora TaxID=936078 RepID=A0A9P8VHQ8_9PEZI|nr:subtilase [Plectosphaerella plurivora]
MRPSRLQDVLLASCGWAHARGLASRDIDSTVERQYVPGAYSFSGSQDTGAFLAGLSSKSGVSGVSERLRLDSAMFRGASFNLKVAEGDKEEDALTRLQALPELNLSWTARHKPAAKFQRRQVGNGGYSSHVMTQTDRLHKQGITGKGLRIGIVDTGIDYTHPALGGCFGPGCLVEFGADLVGEGYDGTAPPNPDDDPFEECNGHGTHVAGIIAALENPLGFIGAASGAKIGMYRAFSCSDSTTLDALMAATSKAYEDGSDIITGSIGVASGWSQNPFALLVSRIVAAGVPCTFAAGTKVGGTEGLFGISTPSDGDGVIAVLSFQNTHLTTSDAATVVVTETIDKAMGGYISHFTSWGPTFDVKLKPDVGAPGGNILSTLPVVMGGYGVESGTSMACPLLVAIVTLIAEARGTRDPTHITALLSSTATPGHEELAPVPQQGAGLVQAYDAAFSQVILDKTRLSFNDTENFVPQDVFTAKNHGNTTVKFTLLHRPALTANTLWPDVDVSALPIYSGWVVLNGTSDNGPISPIVLPYVGAASPMRHVTVFASSRLFTSRSDNPRSPILPAGATIQIPVPNTNLDWARDPLEETELILPVGAFPSQHIWLVMGSAEVRLEVQQVVPSCYIPAPQQLDNVLGEKTLGNIAGYPSTYHRHIVWMAPWDGRLADGSWAAPGRYRFILYALRTYGDRSKGEDWDHFFSTEFRVRYVRTYV